MPKENNQVNPYEELNLPAREIEETLPFDPEEDIPRKAPVKDYLDEFIPSSNGRPQNYSEPLMFGDSNKENLIKDLLKVDWERIEHIVRGHKPMIDDEGNEYFIKMEGHYLNEYGVNSILHYLSFYLSKDIKLGRYSADQVGLIMKQFARQFTDFFYDNINEFGLDTPAKKKMSKMFVHSVIALVDAAYSNAIEGKTIELMLKQFSVMQQEPLHDQMFNPSPNQPRKPSMMQRIFG